MPDKIMVTDSRSLLQNGTQKYAKRYSNGSIEYFGFSTQAEAEEFLKQKKDTETLKESTPFKNELATAQTIDKSGNKPTDQINNMPAPIVDDVINVIRDYDWTYSKNKIKKWIDIPYVELNEFKLAGNSYLSSLMTSALLFPDILESSYGENTLVNNFYQTLKKDFEKNEFGKFMGSLGENANKVTEKLQKGVSDFTNRINDQVRSIDKTAEAWLGITGSQDLKQKYAYLYIREPTGRKYRLPYFDKNFFNIGNDFGDTYNNESVLGKSMKRLNDYMSAAANLIDTTALTEPGMYIQRPKFYNFSTNEYVLNVDFYLFNTISPDEYVKNLQLITKLVVQNTPHRHNRVLVDPVCIYELKVPGRGFYPYTFISKLEVTHEGTKRVLSVNGKDMIIPEAFKVSIGLKSLTSEVNNFIIPETGDAGIKVGQRYGFKKDNTKVTSQNPQNAPILDTSSNSGGPQSTLINTGTKGTSVSEATFLPNIKT